MQRKAQNICVSSNPELFLGSAFKGNNNFIDSIQESDLVFCGKNSVENEDMENLSNFILQDGLDVNSVSFDPTNFSHVEDILIPGESRDYLPNSLYDTFAEELIYLEFSNEKDSLTSSFLNYNIPKAFCDPLDKQLGVSPALSSPTLDHNSFSNMDNPKSCLNFNSEAKGDLESPFCDSSRCYKDKPESFNMVESLSPQDVELTTSLNKSGRKPKPLKLTDEEKSILKNEGVIIPENVRTLTKTEERHIKQVKRRIKNKISAAESRKRKREYLDGLEDRVQHTTSLNWELQRRVCELQGKNNDLILTIHKMRNYFGSLIPDNSQKHISLLIFLIAFALFSFPSWISISYASSHNSLLNQKFLNVHSRILLSPEFSSSNFNTNLSISHALSKIQISKANIYPQLISSSNKIIDGKHENLQTKHPIT